MKFYMVSILCVNLPAFPGNELPNAPVLRSSNPTLIKSLPLSEYPWYGN